MTREEEIKGLADFLECDCLNKPNDYCNDSDCSMCRATALVDTGWRKRAKGEWSIKKIGDGGTTRTCSNCLMTQTVNVYNGKVMFRYCPYCGAEMENEK